MKSLIIASLASLMAVGTFSAVTVTPSPASARVYTYRGVHYRYHYRGRYCNNRRWNSHGYWRCR